MGGNNRFRNNKHNHTSAWSQHDKDPIDFLSSSPDISKTMRLLMQCLKLQNINTNTNRKGDLTFETASKMLMLLHTAYSTHSDAQLYVQN